MTGSVHVKTGDVSVQVQDIDASAHVNSIQILI